MTVVVTLCFLFTNFFFGWLSVCVSVWVGGGGVKFKPTNDYEKKTPKIINLYFTFDNNYIHTRLYKNQDPFY